MGAPIKSDELFQAWARKDWRNFYLFAGQEDFLIKQALQQAQRHWLKDDAGGLNKDRMDGDRHTAGEILQAAQTVPFLAEHRFVQVDNAAKLSAAEQEELVEGLTRLPTETRMIFIWGKEWRREDQKKPLVEALTRLGQVVIFWPMYTDNAQRWVIQRAKHYGKTLAADAAVWLVQQAGEGLRLLDQELAKCSAFVGGRPAIELEDVQASFGYEKATSPFDWVAAIRQKRGPVAVGILEHLLEEGDEPLRLLALLEKNLREWLSAKGSGDNPAMLAMRFRVRRGEENRFAQELARWSEAELTNALGRCVEAEQGIKTGKETPEMALTLLTLALGRLEAAYSFR